MKSIKFVILVLMVAVGLAGCDSKQGDDVAAIRAQMEKEAAEKADQKARAKANFEAFKKNAQKSAARQT